MSTARVLAYSLGPVAGTAVGLLGSFTFAYTAAALPVGLVVAVSLQLAVLTTAGLAARSRGAAALAGSGAFVATLALTVPRPEGDLVVPATVLGYSWLVGGLVATAIAIAVPYAGRDTRRLSGPPTFRPLR